MKKIIGVTEVDLAAAIKNRDTSYDLMQQAMYSPKLNAEQRAVAVKAYSEDVKKYQQEVTRLRAKIEQAQAQIDKVEADAQKWEQQS